MTRLSITLTLALLLLFQNSALGCTSFARLVGKPLFGMNFDYAQFPMKLIVENHAKSGTRTFHLAFEKKLGDQTLFANTAGMNSHGLFYACQELYPPISPDPSGPEETPLFMINAMVNKKHNVMEIQRVLSHTRATQIPGVTLHTLFADASGRALIVEPSASKHHLIESSPQTPWLIMANFPNHLTSDKNQASGIGADRYRALHNALTQTQNAFSVKEAFAALEAARNRNPLYPTSCSMVFKPQTQEIFLAFHCNFNQIWKVALSQQKLLKIKGNNVGVEHQITESGILVSTLVKEGVQENRPL